MSCRVALSSSRSFVVGLSLSVCAAVAAQDVDPPQFDVAAAFADAVPPVAEARWTLVPWRFSLTDALAEAKRTDKPVFLFVNDGVVDSGQC